MIFQGIRAQYCHDTLYFVIFQVASGPPAPFLGIRPWVGLQSVIVACYGHILLLWLIK